MRSSDWSSDVCSSDLVQYPRIARRSEQRPQLPANEVVLRRQPVLLRRGVEIDQFDEQRLDMAPFGPAPLPHHIAPPLAHHHASVRSTTAARTANGRALRPARSQRCSRAPPRKRRPDRSEEPTSALPPPMRLSYAVLSLNKNTNAH